jgi:hypothetical protein
MVAIPFLFQQILQFSYRPHYLRNLGTREGCEQTSTLKKGGELAILEITLNDGLQVLELQQQGLHLTLKMDHLIEHNWQSHSMRSQRQLTVGVVPEKQRWALLDPKTGLFVYHHAFAAAVGYRQLM